MHRVVVILIYSLLALTGLLGNIWVISTVVGQFFVARRNHYPQHQSAQTSAHLYLLLLSIVDLISTAAVPLLDVDVAQSQWPFGSLACKLLFTFEGSNKSLTPLVLMALSVDRYVAVCHGGRHRLREWRYAIGISACCIGVSLLFILPVTFEASVTSLWDSNKREHVKCTVMMPPIYDLLHTTICFILPLSAICCVYAAILWKLYQHIAKVKEARCTSRIPVWRVLKSSVMVVVFYFICWTPYWAHRLMNMLASREDYLMAIHNEELAVAGYISQLEHMFDQSGTANLTSMLEGMNIIQLIKLHDELVRDENIARFSSPFLSAQQHPPPLQQESSFMIHMLEMYLLHALPYCQCAFNWLFYSFLSRNLRQQHQHPRHTFIHLSRQQTRTDRSPNHQDNGNALPLNSGTEQAVVRRKSEPVLLGHESIGQLSPDSNSALTQSRMRRMSKSDYNLFLPASITASTAITELSKVFEQCQEEGEERVSTSSCHHDHYPPRTPSPLALLLPAGRPESTTNVV